LNFILTAQSKPSKMCLNCLNIILRDNDDYIKTIDEYLSGVECPCCISFPKLLKCLCYDMKVYILLLKKRVETDDVSYEIMAEEKKNKISLILEDTIAFLFDSKEELDDGIYLTRMNQIHELNNMMTRIDEAHHR